MLSLLLLANAASITIIELFPFAKLLFDDVLFLFSLQGWWINVRYVGKTRGAL
jgi:hypothetical protein